MWTRRTNINLALIILLVSLESFVQGSDTEIVQLNTAADLDLSGDVVYAINFGNTGNPRIGDIVFSEDEAHPEVSVTASAEQAVPSWYGVHPNTGDSNLDMLIGGVAWTNDGPGKCTTYVSIGGLQASKRYHLQLIFYEARLGENRRLLVVADGKTVVDGYNVLQNQGGGVEKAGSVLQYGFVAEDDTLGIEITPQPNNGGFLSSICGFILTQIPEPAIAFADFGSGTTIELAVGRGTWQINWGQGPWTWSDDVRAPLLDANVSGILDLQTTATADISDDLMATLPIAGKLTLSAHDAINKELVIGTMVLSGTGVNVIDIDAGRVIMDAGSGMCLAPFPAPAPKLTLALEEATGVFAYIEQSEDWELSFAGSYAAPLIEGMELQDNIFAALGGNVPVIGGIGTFSLSGAYVPDEAKRAKAFCAYGAGVSERLGAGGALWNQVWTGGSWDWHDCPAQVNVPFLGAYVSGTLETFTAGAPSIDENMVLSFTFGGQMKLSDPNDSNPEKIDGEIIADADGTFVADINAERATFDADGNIVIAFGVSVHDAPDAFITVTEVTGTYTDIQQAGPWAWYVDGTMTIARVPDLPLQQNILAALQQAELLLDAREEFVLTGHYLRQAQ